MGSLENIIYARITLLERDGEWSPGPDITYFKFKIEVVNEFDKVFRGVFFQPYLKEVEDLGFKIGDWRYHEIKNGKIKTQI